MQWCWSLYQEYKNSSKAVMVGIKVSLFDYKIDVQFSCYDTVG